MFSIYIVNKIHAQHVNEQDFLAQGEAALSVFDEFTKYDLGGCLYHYSAKWKFIYDEKSSNHLNFERIYHTWDELKK